MATRLKFPRRELLRSIRKRAKHGLRRAGAFYLARAKEAAGKRSLGADQPSAPGEPPRRQTGVGYANIVMQWDAATPAARVGVTNDGLHLFWLEIGTRTVAARPWLVPTLLEHADSLAGIVQSELQQESV